MTGHDEFDAIRRSSAVQMHEDGSATLTIADLPVSCFRCETQNFIEDTVAVWTPFDRPVPGLRPGSEIVGVWTGGCCYDCLRDGDQVDPESIYEISED